MPADLGARIMVKESEQDGGESYGSAEHAAGWDGLSSGSDEGVTFFDEDELSIQWSEWRPRQDYVKPMRDARSAETLLGRWLRRIPGVGTQVRTFARCTPDGEPVTSLAMHPDAWRYLVALAADGEKYRRMMAKRGALPDEQSDADSAKESGRSWRERCSRTWLAARNIAIAR